MEEVDAVVLLLAAVGAEVVAGAQINPAVQPVGDIDAQSSSAGMDTHAKARALRVGSGLDRRIASHRRIGRRFIRGLLRKRAGRGEQQGCPENFLHGIP